MGSYHMLTKRQLRDLPIHPNLVEAVDSLVWNSEDRELIVNVPEYHDIDMIGAINCARAVSNSIKQIQVIVNNRTIDASYVRINGAWQVFRMKSLSEHFR